MEKRNAPAVWRGRPLKGVLFDLDGTMLNTAADIARALNLSLAEYALPPLAVTDVTGMVGRGAFMLIQRATAVLAPSMTDVDRAGMVERFFHHYGELEERGESDAAPYPHVVDTVAGLHAAGLTLGVVTNKHSRFANALLQHHGLSRLFGVVVGGDTCERRKPDPLPLLFACESLGIAPDQALMVGDSMNDIQAARAASIPVVCVPYGYTEGRDPRTLPCDAFIETFAELPGLLWSSAP